MFICHRTINSNLACLLCMSNWEQFYGSRELMKRGGLTYYVHRIRRRDFQLKEWRRRLDIWRNFFTQKAVKHQHSCPEKLWMPLPWRCSRQGWMGPWIAWAGGEQPCPLQGVGTWVSFKVSSNPSSSLILWEVYQFTWRLPTKVGIYSSKRLLCIKFLHHQCIFMWF